MNRNLCYKCSIGKHSQHSVHTGKGGVHYIYTDGWEHDHEVCECPVCYNPKLYGGYRPIGGRTYGE